MPKLRSLYPTIRLAVACLVLAIGFRTWLVMGLIEPVTVSGSSMVPEFRGACVTPTCPNCDQSFNIGVEFAADVERVSCPACGHQGITLDGITVQRGTRLWVDRLSLQWREPKRWEAVVARNPQDADELCIKRVVGLPGEQIGLRGGDVRVDGAIVVKSTQEQSLVRQLLHHEKAKNQRWAPMPTTTWQLRDDNWQNSNREPGIISWLTYAHPDGKPITDDVPYNAGLTRRLNVVDEFLLSLDLEIRGEGSILFRLDDGSSSATVRVMFPDGQLELTESGQRGATLPLDGAVMESLTGGMTPVTFTNFDQQLLLVIDKKIALRRRWPSSPAAGTDQPMSIGVEGLTATLGNLRLFRDIYHSSHPVAAPAPLSTLWHLGADEYFLLGDNAPVSLDSRLWGPVPARLIIGRPL